MKRDLYNYLDEAGVQRVAKGKIVPKGTVYKSGTEPVIDITNQDTLAANIDRLLEQAREATKDIDIELENKP